MRRDTIFYQLFLQSPALLFDLIPGSPADANEYVFRSIEVKETSFRIDGVFLSPTPEGLIFFCEAQFQPDATSMNGWSVRLEFMLFDIEMSSETGGR
jgi:predicted transposase YdaD